MLLNCYPDNTESIACPNMSIFLWLSRVNLTQTDSPTPYSKHFKPEIIRDFSVSDGEWFSMGCTNPHFMDYIDHAEGTWFANEDARDNLSLLRLPFEVLSVYWFIF